MTLDVPLVLRTNHSEGFMQALFRQCGHLMLTITRMPQPVIARVHVTP